VIALAFPDPYTGTGSVIPFGVIPAIISVYEDGNGDIIGVASGQSQVSAVPEPSSAIAAGCGGLALLGYFARRRHRAPLACAG
jgi:hypothetical protein